MDFQHAKNSAYSIFENVTSIIFVTALVLYLPSIDWLFTYPQHAIATGVNSVSVNLRSDSWKSDKDERYGSCTVYCLAHIKWQAQAHNLLLLVLLKKSRIWMRKIHLSLKAWKNDKFFKYKVPSNTISTHLSIVVKYYSLGWFLLTSKLVT